MAGPANIYRRPSGMYCARLVVPERLRPVVGKAELHASTGSRTLAVAKAVAASVLAHWREKLLALDRMDVTKIALGSPSLVGGGYLRMAEASAASGFTEDELLQKASEGRLSLYVHLAGQLGHFVSREAVQGDPDAFVGDHRAMPVASEERFFTGPIAPCQPRDVAGVLLVVPGASVQVFEQGRHAPFVFVADTAVSLSRGSLLLAAADVEALRVVVAAGLTKEQIRVAKAPARPKAAKGTTGRLSTFLDAYAREKADSVRPDEARRIRDLLNLFIDMTGDPFYPDDVTNAMLDDFEKVKLARVPDHEEKVRLKLGTRTVQESVAALAGTDYKRMTGKAIAKRMGWVQGFLAWVKARGELRLTGRGRAPDDSERPSEVREKFSDAELQAIFSDPIFAAGRGAVTKRGTIFKFKPWHYWGPLIALLSGMRPNEQCQMLTTDIVGDAGVWWFDIAEDDSEDGSASKSLKNMNSRRQIPVHPLLIDLGLIEWRDRLQREGHPRLFPEWSPHAGHGRYSPKAGQWFNDDLRKRTLGAGVSPKKTLYSFRHNFGTALLESGCSDRIARALMGHSPGKGELRERYDKARDSPKLVPAVGDLDFKLPTIARFDIEAGLAALLNALQRSRNVRQGKAGRKLASAAK